MYTIRLHYTTALLLQRATWLRGHKMEIFKLNN